jgi:RimJ/RimL family protein N-acetyltransferase
VHKTVQAAWVNNPFQTLNEKDTLSMLFEFCQICFKKYQIHKIQFSFLEKPKEALLSKIGAVKEGIYQKHFYSQGQFHDVQSYRLFKEELRAA